MKSLIAGIKRDSRDLALIIAVFLLAVCILYGYYGFLTPYGMSYIFRNWDGPGYVVVAKTFYDVNLINKINPFWFLNAVHYAYQFPLYPVFIRIFSFMGYNQSMIFTSQLFSLFFVIALYYLVKIANPKANALAVALLAIFYTPRWFIVSHVGSTEPLFVFFITLFMICYLKKKYWLSALWVSLAQLSKPQGIVFFAGISLFYLVEVIARKKSLIKAVREYLPFLLIPISLIGIFILYYFKYGNFFAFMGNEAFPTMQWPPLKIFTATEVYATTIGLFTVWKESLIFTYIVYFIPIAVLFQKKFYLFAITALVYFLPVLLFVQTDMARFILPILPFAFLGLSDGLSKKPVYIALFLCIPMVYLYSIGYINFNLAPLP
jgi:4-amino-4-deoxy-L-arabinose transferase-like glycosyltransferase